MNRQVPAPLGDRWAEVEPGPRPWKQACLVDAHQDSSHRNQRRGVLGTFLGLARWGGRVWRSSRMSVSPPHLGYPAVSQSWISKARAHLWGNTGPERGQRSSCTGSRRPVGPQAPWLESLCHWSAGLGLQVAPPGGVSPKTPTFNHSLSDVPQKWGKGPYVGQAERIVN